MPLHPEAKALLDSLAASGTGDNSEMDPETVRAGYELLGALGRPAPEPPSTQDRLLPGPVGEIPVRIYRPGSGSGWPLVVFFHGGGFVIGSVNSHDPLCQQISTGVPAVVLSVDYRLAPEHKFPAGLEDCWAATRWAYEHARELGADPSRLAVAGDSAGGNLAAVISRRARDAGSPPLRFQLLIYPTVDATMSSPSIEENGKGLLLTADTMRWFMGHYLEEGTDPRQPDISPLWAPDLAGLAPAMVVTAEFDPLRDEGEAYARRLAEADVPVQLARYDGMIHAFFQLDSVLSSAGPAIFDSIQALRGALAG